MSLGDDRSLYLLAFDHQVPSSTVSAGDLPNLSEMRRGIIDAKIFVYEAKVETVAAGAPERPRKAR